MRLPVIALLLASAIPAVRAEDSCPALTREDADILLGAPTQLQVNWRSGNSYECHFDAGAARLTVTVRPYRFQNGWASYAAQCIGEATPVPGIGDEAVQCSSAGTGQVLGHVRDTLLDVRLSPTQADTLPRAAQKVAGNLR